MVADWVPEVSTYICIRKVEYPAKDGVDRHALARINKLEQMVATVSGMLAMSQSRKTNQGCVMNGNRLVVCYCKLSCLGCR